MTSLPGTRSEPSVAARAGGKKRLEGTAKALICLAVLIGVTGVFVRHPALTGLGGFALVAFLWLSRHRLGLVAMVPLGLATLAFAGALWRGVSMHALLAATDRALFLTALLCMLTFLRQAAGRSADVAKAGAFLTGQPPGRRYIALCFGGHLFGTLINLGGLAILLDMAARDNRANSAGLPPYLQELKLKRMTLAIVRGFTFVAFWSPLGFAVNSLLLSMPGLNYAFLGPVGLAMTVPVFGLGLLFDRLLAPGGPRRMAEAPENAMGAVLRLVGHVALLGALVMAFHAFGPFTFQEALLIAVPLYALVWLAFLPDRDGPGASIRTGLLQTVEALPKAAGEIGVFASAGLLAVLLMQVLPVDLIEQAFVRLDLPPAAIAPFLGTSVFLLGLVGINPIISASVLGALVVRLGIEGLSQAGAAFAMLSAWSSVMGHSPFITTVAYAGAIVGRSPVRVGLRWNGPYAVTLLVLSQSAVAAAIHFGWL